MGQQRLNQKKTTVATHPQPTKTSVKSPVYPVEELQGVVGNREMGRLMETNCQSHPSGPFPKLQGELPLLGGMMPVSQETIQRQPLFRGLSQELRLDTAMALPATGAVIQPKLTLGTPGDMYEEEADSVARQVVDEIHSSPFREQNTQPEEERKPEVGEAGRVQRQITVQAAGDAGGEFSSVWEGELQSAKSGGQPLSPTLKEPMERSFGADFGGVRVHTGAQADMLARSIQAKAFTTGQDVFFRQGAYEPGSRGGQELLAHELTHVVQQGEAASIQGKGDRRVRDVMQGQEPLLNQTKIGTQDLSHAGIENLTGWSKDNVRIHSNCDKPAQSIQRLIIDEALDLTADDVWKLIQPDFDDITVEKEHQNWMKQKLQEMEPNTKFATYEDVRDQLLKELNQEYGRNYEYKENLIERKNRPTAIEKIMKFLVIYLAATKALESMIPGANAKRLNLPDSPPTSLRKDNSVCATDQSIWLNSLGINQICQPDPNAAYEEQLQNEEFARELNKEPSKLLEEYRPPHGTPVYENGGQWKDWVNMFQTYQWKYHADPTKIQDVHFLTKNVKLVNGYYAYAYRVSDNKIAYTYTGQSSSTNNVVAHSYLASGKEVYAAGMFSVDNEKITMVNSASGHYRPDPKMVLGDECKQETTSMRSLEITKEKMKDLGLATDTTQLIAFRDPNFEHQLMNCQEERTRRQVGYNMYR